MNFESILGLVIGSIILGVLGGFAARSVWVGIGLPVVLIVFGFMWFAVKPDTTELPKEEEVKKDNNSENTTQPTQV